MTGLVRRHPILATLVFVALAGGCGSGGCGCGEQPLQRDLDPADKVYDGVVAEISPDGFAFLEQNFGSIIDQFMPGGLAFDMPADPRDCKNDMGCGGQVMCKGSTPCAIGATIHDVGLATRAPDRLALGASIDISSGDIPLQVCQKTLWCNRISCSIKLQVKNKPVSADIVFGQDNLSKALTFDVTNVDVNIQGDDFRIDGGILCDIADWGFIRNWIADFANGEIKKQIPALVEEQIDAFTCMPCDFYATGCDGAGFGASCDSGSGYCVDPATSACVHKPLGLVGRVDAGQVIGSLAPIGGQPAWLDVSTGLGQDMPPPNDPVVPTDDGPLDLRMISGVHGDPSPCVPEASSIPDTSPPPRVDFAAEAGGESYMVGVGISDRFLDKAFYEAYRSGALCIDLGTDAVDMITTGLFKTFLPSLDGLTEGRNAPMLIALRPKERPQVDVGLGTWHDENGTPVLEDPLLTVHLPDLGMDVYALVEDRYVRLFSLTVDIGLPLALELTPDNQLVPILGDLGALVTNIRATNSELLAEDPAVLEDLIPAVIGLAEPMLAGALAPIALPDVQGFALRVKKLQGMVPAATPGTYEHVGLLADLELVGAPQPLRADTHAVLESVVLPPRDTLRAGPGRRLGRPALEVDVTATGKAAGAPGLEWQYRLDGGFWSPFQRTARLSIRAPGLLLQGRHVVEVRARSVGDYRTLDPTPARITALVDWEAPRVRLAYHAATGVLEAEATDLVSPPERLTYAFSVDGGAFGAFSAERTFEAPVDAREVRVRVMDEAGNVAEALWSAGGGPVAEAGPAPEVGCASAPGGAGGLALMALAALLASVRRRRA